MSSPSGNVEDLERRLAVLEDKAAIVDLFEKHTQALDFADEQTYVDCYTEDGLFETYNQVTGAVSTVYGRNELRRKIASHTRPPELYHQHLVGHPIVHLDGDGAHATSYYLLSVGMSGGLPKTVMFGRFIDVLRRESDGRWRIAIRRAEVGAFDPIWSDLRDIRRRAQADGQREASHLEDEVLR